MHPLSLIRHLKNKIIVVHDVHINCVVHSHEYTIVISLAICTNTGMRAT